MTMKFFFFNDTATTEIYTLSLHDALPIYPARARRRGARLLRRHRADHRRRLHRHERRVPRRALEQGDACPERQRGSRSDRKSTRLNSSHANISYAVFCLKKKNIRGAMYYS